MSDSSINMCTCAANSKRYAQTATNMSVRVHEGNSTEVIFRPETVAAISVRLNSALCSSSGLFGFSSPEPRDASQLGLTRK